MAAALSLGGLAAKRCFSGFSKAPVVLAASVFITPNSIIQQHHQLVKAQARDYATSSVAQASYGKHWKYEKVVTVGLLALIPAGLIYPNALVDYGLALTIPLHGHWGFESVIEDYVPDGLKKVSHILLYCVSIGTFAGLMYLNFSDVGICNAVKMIWSL